MSSLTLDPRADSADSPAKEKSKSLSGAFALLNPTIQRSVSKAGYKTPTPIQEECISHILEGKDLLGSAQTGTGKTAAFTLPLLHCLAENRKPAKRGTPRALILAPTRELAAQINDSLAKYGRNLKFKHTAIFGGVSQFGQEKALKRGVDILVATPGRLLDLMRQRLIDLKEVEFFVLDEVDRMLDMGFIPDIKTVLSKIPKSRQTLFFSATMPPAIVELANTMVKDPVRISIAPGKPVVDRIDQSVMFVKQKQKIDLLISLLRKKNYPKTIVFIQRKHIANSVVKKLTEADIRADAIHGNKSQSARTKTLSRFKSNKFKVLVATDVAARGLDVDDITHVINFDLPMEDETYVHRIGRTARAGAKGIAISFCSRDDKNLLFSIEKLLGKDVPQELEHDFHCDEAFLAGSRATGNRRRNGGYAKRRSGGSSSRSRSGGNSGGSKRSYSKARNSKGDDRRTKGSTAGAKPKKRTNNSEAKQSSGETSTTTVRTIKQGSDKPRTKSADAKRAGGSAKPKKRTASKVRGSFEEKKTPSKAKKKKSRPGKRERSERKAIKIKGSTAGGKPSAKAKKQAAAKKAATRKAN